MKNTIFNVIVSIVLIITTTFSIMNWFNINNHHKSKYPEYSYAYDCLKEAEITYWDYKCALVNEVQNYITTVAPSSNLRGYALVEECEKYNIDICFALAQGEIESHFGTKGMAAKTNIVWNVKTNDGRTLQDIQSKGDDYDHPNQSIESYLKLLVNSYLVDGKIEEDMFTEFVNFEGNRYASNPNYENLLRDKYNYIKENTKIAECYMYMKSWAIKCNR